jgi:hypothetical protein
MLLLLTNAMSTGPYKEISKNNVTESIRVSKLLLPNGAQIVLQGQHTA